MRAGFLSFGVLGLPSWFLDPGPASSAWALLLSPSLSLSEPPGGLVPSPVTASWGLDSFHFGIWVKGSFHLRAPDFELNSYIAPVTREKIHNHQPHQQKNPNNSLLLIFTLLSVPLPPPPRPCPHQGKMKHLERQKAGWGRGQTIFTSPFFPWNMGV